MQVVILRRDLLKEDAAKNAKQGLHLGAPKSVSLLGAEDGVKLSIGKCAQLKASVGENPQATNTGLALEQLVERKDAGRAESKSMVEQCGPHTQGRHGMHFGDLRLAGEVPVLERGM